MVNMMMRGDKLARLTRRRKRKLEIAVRGAIPCDDLSFRVDLDTLSRALGLFWWS
jgi:hypothetical protein